MRTISKLRADKPKERGIYGVPTGSYRGEMFVYMESSGFVYRFLSLPKMELRVVPHDNFDFGVKNNILEFIQELPKDVYSVCKAQYEKIRVNEQDITD